MNPLRQNSIERQRIVEADGDGWPLVDEQLVLIDCHLPRSQVKRDYPALWRYLEQGQGLGIRERYLVKQRDPWYGQEQRPPAPFLCTYMGRGTNGGKPALPVLLNRSKATAHNVYLLLYPKGGLKQILTDTPSLEESIFRFLESISKRDLVWEDRVYGGGLHKLEPTELGRISAQQLLDLLGVKTGKTKPLPLPF